MPRPPQNPQAPRISPPDLSPRLEPAAGLSPRADLVQRRIERLSDDVDAAHARLTECAVAPASVDRLDVTGATLVDVEIADLRALEVRGRSSRWRGVRVSGGRIATLDLTLAELDNVEFAGVRIDYLVLGQAVVHDVLFTECQVRTLDLPQARVDRLRFEGCRADEVDSRGLTSTHLDLRGLEALSYTDPLALRGATLAPRQLEILAPSFAAALGIDVKD